MPVATRVDPLSEQHQIARLKQKQLIFTAAFALDKQTNAAVLAKPSWEYKMSGSRWQLAVKRRTIFVSTTPHNIFHLNMDILFLLVLILLVSSGRTEKSPVFHYSLQDFIKTPAKDIRMTSLDQWRM